MFKPNVFMSQKHWHFFFDTKYADFFGGFFEVQYEIFDTQMVKLSFSGISGNDGNGKKTILLLKLTKYLFNVIKKKWGKEGMKSCSLELTMLKPDSFLSGTKQAHYFPLHM